MTVQAGNSLAAVSALLAVKHHFLARTRQSY